MKIPFKDWFLHHLGKIIVGKNGNNPMINIKKQRVMLEILKEGLTFTITEKDFHD